MMLSSLSPADGAPPGTILVIFVIWGIMPQWQSLNSGILSNRGSSGSGSFLFGPLFGPLFDWEPDESEERDSAGI